MIDTNNNTLTPTDNTTLKIVSESIKSHPEKKSKLNPLSMFNQPRLNLSKNQNTILLVSGHKTYQLH